MADPFNTQTMSAALAGTGSAEQGDKAWVGAQAFDYAAMTKAPDDQQWDGHARVYEWKEEFGDVGPELPELEFELFGPPSEREDKARLDFSTLTSIEVHQEGPTKISPIKAFSDAGLHPAVLANVRLSGYRVPTPIQKFTIPAILGNHDVIGIAQTGSGKTAAYLVPILSKLMGKAKKLAAPRPNPETFREGIDEVVAEPLALIVLPTRELAIQVFNEARKACYRTMLRPCCVYGGTPLRQQIGLLSRGADVLIATPGRLCDLIQRPNVLTLRRLRYTVIDEADELLQDDWQENMQIILQGGEQDVGNIRFAMFSATFPKAGRELARQYLSASHVRFRVGRAGSSHKNIKQIVIQVEPREKRTRLLEILADMPGVRTIVFVASRQGCDDLDDYCFNQAALPVTSIHSDRTQIEREAALRAFRSGKAPILIATGVTARGIDVKGVLHVINYDFPQDIESYTHRIGRTGRAGWRGVATSFMTERDAPMSEILTKFLIETDQDIPDFLESYVPVGEAREHLKFESDSDADEQQATEGSGDAGWGSPGPDTTDAASGAGWGGDSGTTGKEETSGWGGAASSANDNAQWGAGQDAGGVGAVGTW